jgi:hypothetical protein
MGVSGVRRGCVPHMWMDPVHTEPFLLACPAITSAGQGIQEGLRWCVHTSGGRACTSSSVSPPPLVVVVSLVAPSAVPADTYALLCHYGGKQTPFPRCQECKER